MGRTKAQRAKLHYLQDLYLSHVEFQNVLNKSGKEEKGEKLTLRGCAYKRLANAYIKSYRKPRILDIYIMTAKMERKKRIR